MSRPTVRVLGVDGCRGGWVGVVLEDDEAPVPMFAASIGALAVAAGPVAAIGIDIPIHLNEETDRPCDAAARRLIAPCGSRVFNAPVRDVLAAKTYDEALRISRGRCGKGISKQTWHLVPKIAEVEAWFAAPRPRSTRSSPRPRSARWPVASCAGRSTRETVRRSGVGHSRARGSRRRHRWPAWAATTCSTRAPRRGRQRRPPVGRALAFPIRRRSCEATPRRSGTSDSPMLRRSRRGGGTGGGSRRASDAPLRLRQLRPTRRRANRAATHKTCRRAS